jgi:hypothetical protein
MKMYASVLEKVKCYEEKNGIVYTKTDDKPYKALKVLYVLAFLYSMGINFLFAVGCLFNKTYFESLKNSFISVVTLSVILIISLVLMRFKENLWMNVVTFLLNVLSCVGLGLIFGQLLKDVIGFKASFYWRHVIPLGLMVLFTMCLTYIAVRAALKLRKNYKKVLENLYTSRNTSGEGEGLTVDEWDEILGGK